MDEQRDTKTLSPAAKAWTGVVAAALVVWFFFAWLFLDRHLLDAAGESVGTRCSLGRRWSPWWVRSAAPASRLFERPRT